MKNIVCVVGARPNFMKMAPLLRAVEEHRDVCATLVHTGQHYDSQLSDVFFQELGMKKPEIHLEVGSGKHGAQSARVLEKMEEVLERGPANGSSYDRLVVVGDVNSTMAATLAAAKLGIPVAHVEAGLRSFDRTMPEEINRIVTDALSDMLLVSEPAGVDNLRREGHDDGQVHLVGNIMIDTLMTQLAAAQKLDVLGRFGLEPGAYGVVTLHRPSNVDQRATLQALLDVLIEISKDLKLVFPVHPRTKGRLEEFGLLKEMQAAPGILQQPPLGYLEFLAMTSQAKVIVTDSGGLQEESTALGIPCLTMRENTERPITVDVGTSTLIGSDAQKLRECLGQVLSGNYKVGTCPELWDGKAAQRIAKVIAKG
ncbi:MAG: non-hydrolyzing UDP-N-acetylglucosamine 2-epimerase [Pirellulaceae bacterium]